MKPRLTAGRQIQQSFQSKQDTTRQMSLLIKLTDYEEVAEPLAKNEV